MDKHTIEKRQTLCLDAANFAKKSMGAIEVWDKKQ
jgi:hypothetical protein